MTLNEILRIPQHKGKRYSLNSFDLKNKECVGHTEGRLQICKAHAIDDNNVILYGLFDAKNILLSSIMGVFFSLDGTSTFAVKDALTPVAQQKKGYATSLYVFLVKDLNIRLLSDVEQTPQGESLWRSIQKVVPVKIYDTATKKILQSNAINDEEIYTLDKEQNRYLFITENWLSEGMIELQKQTHISGEILARHIIYTHSAVKGEYD
ncbi:MAG: hypothetical protein ACREAU_09130 [Nitrosopumilaceae archaeon]